MTYSSDSKSNIFVSVIDHQCEYQQMPSHAHQKTHAKKIAKNTNQPNNQREGIKSHSNKKLDPKKKKDY